MELSEVKSTSAIEVRSISEISIGIPAYGRSSELNELLQSIYAMTVLPREVTVCEDYSSERDAIRAAVKSWESRLANEGCLINYHENPANLGYDANLRKVISISTSPWVMIMGNDDLVLDRCIETAEEYLQRTPGVMMVARAFFRFSDDVNQPLGVSRLAGHDQVFDSKSSSSKMVFRSCGFIAGLIVNRQWAEGLATDRYDGTLYYQIYLAANAFCEAGIGYIATPITAGRSGNAPLFGAAASETAVHIPGSYSPKGRASMWAAVLKIARDVGAKFAVDLETDLKKELETRQAFHIFEMYAGANRSVLADMRKELIALDLFQHQVPRSLYALNFIFGKRARYFYYVVRKVIQR